MDQHYDGYQSWRPIWSTDSVRCRSGRWLPAPFQHWSFVMEVFRRHLDSAYTLPPKSLSEGRSFNGIRCGGWLRRPLRRGRWHLDKPRVTLRYVEISKRGLDGHYYNNQPDVRGLPPYG